jgi:hypothetical protein
MTPFGAHQMHDVGQRTLLDVISPSLDPSPSPLSPNSKVPGPWALGLGPWSLAQKPYASAELVFSMRA